jgi:hypothetical protein
MGKGNGTGFTDHGNRCLEDFGMGYLLHENPTWVDYQFNLGSTHK